MRVLAYEHITSCESEFHGSPLLVEAAAMRDAVTTDLANIPGIDVITADGCRFEELAKAGDGVLLIAPETGGVLTSLVRRVEQLGGRLLSPSSEFCEWAGDKTRVAATLSAGGVLMPAGVLVAVDDPWPDEVPLPAVLKPNDGCGSQGIKLICQAGLNAVEGVPYIYRLERFVPGVAASVALLRGPAGVFPLPACSQRLSDDGRFQYLGGSCPLPSPFAARAEVLALRAAAAMPEWRGYIGIDLVLGPADDGSADYVIEVNPRLTTSYVGLRALSETNLAQAMLDVVAGRTPRLSFRPGVVEYDADGRVRYLEPAPNEHGARPAVERK